jgi:glycosyltransferase involved in cell wall biosynthesis
MLLRAFARFATGDDRLLIIGDGPQRRRLARLAARLGIAGQVEMPGHLGSVAEALECADVFVSSSNYEGLPGAIVEALAAGLPVVAARSSPCVAYLLRDGQLGQLVPIRDVAALSEALQNAPAREDAQVGEMRSMAAQFTVERSSELYLAVFAEAATARTGIHWIELQPLQEAA